MASSSLFVLVFLALVMASMFVKPSLSTSRRALDGHGPRPTRTGIRVTLSHVDHGSNLTKFEWLQRGINRSKHRLHRLNGMTLATKDASSNGAPTDVESHVHPGNGEFLMDLAIGTPPTAFKAIMDTGSDLIWTQCQPCDQCFDQPSPIFDPKNSSSFSKMSCSSQLCDVLPTSTCEDGCQYMYTYGDDSNTQGVMATETFTFGLDSGQSVSVRNIGFGCGEDNVGSGFDQGAGLVGLGRGTLSLVSQLGEPKFAYCLTSIDESKPSTLLMGSLANMNISALNSNSNDGNANVMKTTPLTRNPAQPSFYYLTLEGISVGPTRLPIKQGTFTLNDDGTGGMIIDSGTTITYLMDEAFDLLKKEFTKQMKLPVDNSSSAALDLCFKMPKDPSSVEVPNLVLHFKGADLELPSDNYMIGDVSMGLACLAMGGSSGMSIFGNVQQQNILVVHDLAKDTMSFVPTQCDAL